MWVDAETLSDFYQTPLGHLAQRYILKSLEEMWPDVRKEILLGVGFGEPFLDTFRGEAERVLSFMPAPQGAIAWPKGRKNLVALVEESQWPLQDQSVDRTVLFHALEFSDHVEDMLREAWRITRDGGEILVVAPNRRGVWSRVTTTPFGFGTPYTGHQLFAVLSHVGFSPLRPVYCLYTPPSQRRLTRKFSSSFEKFGAYFWRKFGGVVIIPAKKQVLSITPQKTFGWAPRFFKPTVPGGF